jgi:hypothetical protein
MQSAKPIPTIKQIRATAQKGRFFLEHQVFFPPKPRRQPRQPTESAILAILPTASPTASTIKIIYQPKSLTYRNRPPIKSFSEQFGHRPKPRDHQIVHQSKALINKIIHRPIRPPIEIVH